MPTYLASFTWYYTKVVARRSVSAYFTGLESNAHRSPSSHHHATLIWWRGHAQHACRRSTGLGWGRRVGAFGCQNRQGNTVRLRNEDNFRKEKRKTKRPLRIKTFCHHFVYLGHDSVHALIPCQTSCLYFWKSTFYLPIWSLLCSSLFSIMKEV